MPLIFEKEVGADTYFRGVVCCDGEVHLCCIRISKRVRISFGGKMSTTYDCMLKTLSFGEGGDGWVLLLVASSAREAIEHALTAWRKKL